PGALSRIAPRGGSFPGASQTPSPVEPFMKRRTASQGAAVTAVLTLRARIRLVLAALLLLTLVPTAPALAAAPPGTATPAAAPGDTTSAATRPHGAEAVAVTRVADRQLDLTVRSQALG